MALLMQREREQVGVLEPLGDRDRLRGGGLRAALVAGDPPLDDLRQQEIAALDAVGPVPLHQPPGAGEPAAGARGLAPQGEAQPDPERAARRAVGALVGADGALERRHELVVAAEHVRRRREQLEPPGVQLARQRREHGMRLPPRPRRAGITSRCHRGRDVHDDHLRA